MHAAFDMHTEEPIAEEPFKGLAFDDKDGSVRLWEDQAEDKCNSSQS